MVISIGNRTKLEKNLLTIHDKNSQQIMNSGKLTQFNKDIYKMKSIYKKSQQTLLLLLSLIVRNWILLPVTENKS